MKGWKVDILFDIVFLTIDAVIFLCYFITRELGFLLIGFAVLLLILTYSPRISKGFFDFLCDHRIMFMVWSTSFLVFLGLVKGLPRILANGASYDVSLIGKCGESVSLNGTIKEVKGSEGITILFSLLGIYFMLVLGLPSVCQLYRFQTKYERRRNR